MHGSRSRHVVGSLAIVGALSLGAGTSAAAAATKLTRVGAKQHGLHAVIVVAGPDGTAYVQGEVDGQCCGPKIWVFSPSGSLVRTFAIPGGGFQAVALGNGQLYLIVPGVNNGRVIGVNPVTGAIVSQVGTQTQNYSGEVGNPDGLAIGANGTIYESGGFLTVTDPTDPDSTDMIEPVQEFTSMGQFAGYLGSSLGANPPELTVTSVNAPGDVLGAYNGGGTGFVGVYSPQGALLDHFKSFPPGPQYQDFVFSPNGASIYATVELDHPSAADTATTAVEKLSLSGAVLARFGAVSAGSFITTPDDYGNLSVASSGVGWTTRPVDGQLFRFKLG